MHRPLAVVLLLLGACSKSAPDTSSIPAVGSTGTPATGPATGPPTDTDTGHPTTPKTGATATTGVVELDCMPQTCGDADLGATANNGGSDLLPEVICALQALRDAGTGLDGQLRVGSFLDVETGHTLVIEAASRQVLRQSFDGGSQGIPLTLSEVERCTLADASWFQGCLDAPELACLEVAAWVVGCTPDPTAPCP